MTHYAIRHVTRFTYTTPVSESLMEVRMQPRSEGAQRCLRFELGVQPRARVLGYRDYLGNSIHHFDVPARHGHLTLTASAHVQIDPPPALPASLPDRAWTSVDAWAQMGEHFDFRHPSRFAVWNDPLLDYARGLGAAAERAHDPLTTVRQVMAAVHQDFEYVPKSTRVDSPIDVALTARKGVCQDFAHVMIAIVRRLGLPARYVSGYIAQRPNGDLPGLTASATHAWVEVLFPEVGWVGFDPTNNSEAEEPPHPRRHRPRLRRRAAHARRLQGQFRQPARRVGGGHAHRCAGGFRADDAESTMGDRRARASDGSRLREATAVAAAATAVICYSFEARRTSASAGRPGVSAFLQMSSRRRP